MIITQKQEEVRKALALQAKCELQRVVLRECHAIAKGTAEEINGPFSVRVSHKSVADAVVDRTLRIEVRFQIESYNSAEPPERVFEFRCSFLLDYELEESFQPSPESISAFKEGNAVFNSWSYVREFFQSTASRMGLTPPPLPLLRMIPQTKESSRAAPRKRATGKGTRPHASLATE